MFGYFITKKGNGEELDLRSLSGLRRDSGEFSLDKQPAVQKGLGKLYKLPPQPVRPWQPQLPREAHDDQKWVDGKGWVTQPGTGWPKEKREAYLAERQKMFDEIEWPKYEAEVAKYNAFVAKRNKLFHRLMAKVMKTVPAANRRLEYGFGMGSTTTGALARRLRFLLPEDQRKFASLDRRITALQKERTALITEAYFRARNATPEEINAMLDKVRKQLEREKGTAPREGWGYRSPLDHTATVKFDKERDAKIKAEAEAAAKAAKIAAAKREAANKRRRENRLLDKKLGVQPKKKAA